MKYLIIFMLISQIALADDVGCSHALSACSNLVSQQDKSIQMLKGQNKDLEDRLATATKPPLLSPLHYVLIGVLTGSLGMLYLKK